MSEDVPTPAAVGGIDCTGYPGWSGKIGQEEIEITQYWDASSHVCRFEWGETTNGVIPVVVIDGYA